MRRYTDEDVSFKTFLCNLLLFSLACSLLALLPMSIAWLFLG